MEKVFPVLGLMSGTSLDGVDLALCEFQKTGEDWKYRIISASTFDYTPDWKQRLSKAFVLSGRELTELDREYGKFLAELIKKVIAELPVKPQLIASHGHTIFHAPDKGYTLQIGHGGVISAITGIPVVNDFRSMDVALGGQGAPLVPVGDKLLFSEYQACLNLGGFANISFDTGERRRAFDICPVNTVLNKLAEELGKEFDKDGILGSKGKLNLSLLDLLNKLEYYHAPIPKSLGREWLEEVFMPVLHSPNIDTLDLLYTTYQHIALQISDVLKAYEIENVLVTGGGAKNSLLMKLMVEFSKKELIIPDQQLIDYKEALIFAFLGLLNIRGEINCYSSVTGAGKDSVSGAGYGIKI